MSDENQHIKHAAEILKGEQAYQILKEYIMNDLSSNQAIGSSLESIAKQHIFEAGIKQFFRIVEGQARPEQKSFDDLKPFEHHGSRQS